jgi:hypothetical protein
MHYQIKKNETDRICRTQWPMRNDYKTEYKKLEGRDDLENLGINGIYY